MAGGREKEKTKDGVTKGNLGKRSKETKVRTEAKERV